MPRLEFWYRVHKRNGTMPPGLESLDMLQVADKLGAGRCSVVADFTEYETEEKSTPPLGSIRTARGAPSVLRLTGVPHYCGTTALRRALP